MKTARLLGLNVAETQTKKADLNKLSSLLIPGKLAFTLNGDAYRVTSKVATDELASFKLADLNGKPVQTPANFHPVSAALARTAAWMRFVFAYNADFDLYVKEYIKAAGLPVDKDMNWAKWFQSIYPRKLYGITKDPEVVDEAIHQVIITALAHRKDLTKFDPNRLPEGARQQPLEKQVTTYLEWLFKKRVSEAYDFIKDKLQPEEETSIDEGWDEDSTHTFGPGSQPGKQDVGGNRSIIDTEEYATPPDQSSDEAHDLAGLRDQFAAYLQDEESSREIEKLLVIYDFFAKNVGRKLKISDYEQYWRAQTGLGFDSLKPVYAKFYRYIGDFMVAAGMVDASKAKARAVSSSLNTAAADPNAPHDFEDHGMGALNECLLCGLSRDAVVHMATKEAGAEWDPETKTYSHPDRCPKCNGSGNQMAPEGILDTTFQPVGPCSECHGTGKKQLGEASGVNVCPGCNNSNYEINGDEIVCPNCQKNYPVSSLVWKGASKQAGSMCECGHHKTYHDSKRGVCHGGEKGKPCDCNGRFRAKKAASAKIAGQWGERSWDSDQVHDILDKYRPSYDEKPDKKGFDESVPAEKVQQMLGELNPKDELVYLGVVVFLLEHGSEVPDAYRNQAVNIAERLSQPDELQKWNDPNSRAAELKKEIALLKTKRSSLTWEDKSDQVNRTGDREVAFNENRGGNPNGEREESDMERARRGSVQKNASILDDAFAYFLESKKDKYDG
jgi:hypothetical protein